MFPKVLSSLTLNMSSGVKCWGRTGVLWTPPRARLQAAHQSPVAQRYLLSLKKFFYLVVLHHLLILTTSLQDRNVMRPRDVG